MIDFILVTAGSEGVLLRLDGVVLHVSEDDMATLTRHAELCLAGHRPDMDTSLFDLDLEDREDFLEWYRRRLGYTIWGDDDDFCLEHGDMVADMTRAELGDLLHQLREAAHDIWMMQHKDHDRADV
jgi:hypothetical protein